MRFRYIVNPINCAVSAITGLVFLLMGITMLPLNRTVSALLFFILSIIFISVALTNGTLIVLDESGVYKQIFWIRFKKLMWEEIKEVGVCGLKVFKTAGSQKTGTLYIYFSTVRMDDKEMFDMVLKWPPQNKYYMVYSEARLHAVHGCWKNRLKTYNAGDIVIGSAEDEIQ